MDLGLADRHVLVTGASRGIGHACAAGFLREGARLTLVARDPARLEAAAAALRAAQPGARVAVQAADLRDAAAAAAMIDAAEAAGGPVEVLVNSAGAARRTPVEELTPAAWQDAMQAKFFAGVHVMEPLARRMAGRGAGAVVNVIGAGGKVASPIHLPGGAANAALMLVTAGLAAALGPRGVRVNAVNPGLTQTDRLQEGLAADARRQGISVDEAAARATARLPLGRMARPEEIADAVLFLASARASYVNGAVLAMDGALTPMI
ncbi:SDR family oxidoreductase [Piscinibacter sakaiensis]|uniref:3-oxoacyl-ACP reductase n=1 Tax=Piscinibacter sakaiensis TaxID=1547922 RepID=A0A0K8NZS2_PISS1|nr:SDR family oxidoreductase [Piscinibacter sakaiensis]GAP35902.1 3-oxoacyl-ACP reductase [Piscinibacter sakaiensis]